MENEFDQLLWTDRDLKTFYLIPDDMDFTVGSFTIRTLAGKEVKTDANVISIFEVSREEARAILDNDLNLSLEMVREAFNNLQVFHQGTTKSEDHTAPAANEAIQNLVSTMLEYVPELKYEKSEKESTDNLNDKVVLQEKIANYLTSEESAIYFKKISKQVRKIADQLEDPQKLGTNLNEIIKSLSGDLLSELDGSLDQTKQKKRIEKSVRDALKSTSRKNNFGSFKGGIPDPDL